jgi:hypothetical protein
MTDRSWSRGASSLPTLREKVVGRVYLLEQGDHIAGVPPMIDTRLPQTRWWRGVPTPRWFRVVALLQLGAAYHGSRLGLGTCQPAMPA